MVVEGVVTNGRVEVKLPHSWGEGSRVAVSLLDVDEWDEALDAMPMPPDTETHEEFLESIRQSVADIMAGVRGIPLDQAFAQIAAELNLPPVPRM